MGLAKPSTRGPSRALESEAWPSCSPPAPSGSGARGAPGHRGRVGVARVRAEGRHPAHPVLSRGSRLCLQLPHCTRKTFVLQRTACPVPAPTALYPAAWGHSPLMRTNEGSIAAQGRLQALVLLLAAKAPLLEHLSGFWVPRGDTSLVELELLFAFSLSAGAHLNMGMQIFLFLCLIFFFFPPVTFSAGSGCVLMSSGPGCDQNGSQGHRFGLKAESDFPFLRDKAELDPGPRWQEGQRGQENQGYRCCGLAANDKKLIQKSLRKKEHLLFPMTEKSGGEGISDTAASRSSKKNFYLSLPCVHLIPSRHFPLWSLPCSFRLLSCQLPSRKTGLPTEPQN